MTQHLIVKTQTYETLADLHEQDGKWSATTNHTGWVDHPGNEYEAVKYAVREALHADDWKTAIFHLNTGSPSKTITASFADIMAKALLEIFNIAGINRS